MRISDWSSDVCSSDLGESAAQHRPERCSCESGSPEPEETALVTLGSCFRRSTRSALEPPPAPEQHVAQQSERDVDREHERRSDCDRRIRYPQEAENGRGSGREKVCQEGKIAVV